MKISRSSEIERVRHPEAFHGIAHGGVATDELAGQYIRISAVASRHMREHHIMSGVRVEQAGACQRVADDEAVIGERDVGLLEERRFV